MATVTLLAGRLPLQYSSGRAPLSLAWSTHIPRPARPGSCSCAFTRLPMSTLRKGALTSRATTQQDAAVESEEQRLKLDAEARSTMAAVAEAQAGSEGQAPGAWKWAIRKRVWDLLESENLAQLPRPVHHRIPNFVGAGAAAAKVRETIIFSGTLFMF
jgi:5-formyltetrahydrofolate cyclo-ligase